MRGVGKSYCTHSSPPVWSHQVKRGMLWSLLFLGSAPSLRAWTESLGLQCDADGRLVLAMVGAGGGCRVPQSWQVLYQDPAGQWKPVANAGEYGVAKDTFNRVTFDPVETSALRVQVRLQPDFSGGVLEWRVEE